MAGDVETLPVASGWSDQQLTLLPAIGAKGAPKKQAYQLLTGRMGRLTLVVGVSLENTLTQERRMLEAFIILGLVLSATFLAIGFFGSLQSYRKLEQMADTLDRVSRGASDSRLEVSKANDQIDRVSRAMNSHLERLSTLMAMTKASAASIAHDLRTPLSRAVLAVERAIDLPDTPPAAQSALQDVEAELTRLRGIFDAILRISRLETSAAQVKRQSVSIAGVLADLEETFAAVAEDKGQTLTVAPFDADLAAMTDGGMLLQLLANLTQNAINHCPGGTAITLGCIVADDKVVLSVSDTGPGIPEAERERVFELFYQADPTRTKGSSGLGLALVKAIAERLGAALSLKDANPGLRVEIQLDRDLNRSTGQASD